MELTHDFTVPASVEDTWQALTDIEGVAGCFPGAQVTSVEGDSFKGTVKVKLGPIALTYNGTGEFTGKDEAARTMKLAAKGKDRRGNGTAGADVTATMTTEGDQTRVEVVTDLQITGKPAQFGRGVIQDVSDKLLGQFTQCLEQKLAGPAATDAAAPGAAAASDAAAASPAAASSEVGPTGADDQDAEPASAPVGAAAAALSDDDQDAGPASAPAAPESAAGTPPVTPIGSAPPADGIGAAAGQATSAADGIGTAVGQATSADNALNLGATVIPVLVRHYGKQVGAGLGVLFLLLLLRRVLSR